MTGNSQAGQTTLAQSVVENIEQEEAVVRLVDYRDLVTVQFSDPQWQQKPQSGVSPKSRSSAFHGSSGKFRHQLP